MPWKLPQTIIISCSLRTPRYPAVLLCWVIALSLTAVRLVAANPAAIDPSFKPALAGSVVSSVIALKDGSVLVAAPTDLSRGIFHLRRDGSLDPAFQSVPVAFDVLAVQADGKIFVSGQPTSPQRMLRLNADGSLDPSFQMTELTTDGSSFGPNINAVVPLSDGRILIAGYFDQINGTRRGHLARLNADGSLDASFQPDLGTTGISHLQVLPDGDMVVVLPSRFASPAARLRRVKPDGQVDTNYLVDLQDPFGYQFITRMLAQADGRILIGGLITSVNGIPCNGLARLNPDGTVDQTFSAQLAPLPPNNGIYVAEFAGQADGRILVNGGFLNSSGEGRFLLRLFSDGTEDTGFDFGDSIIADARLPAAKLITVEPSGSILIVGKCENADSGDCLGIVRLFGGDADPALPSITIQPGSQALQAGLSVAFAVSARSFIRPSYQWQLNGADLPGATNQTLSLSNVQLSDAGRYRAIVSNSVGSAISAEGVLAVTIQPGTVDRTFYQNLTFTGPALPPSLPGSTFVYQRPTSFALLLHPDGHVWVGGYFTNAAGRSKNHLARLTLGGHLDDGFNDGIGPDGAIEALALQSDGKVLCAGAFSTFNGVPHQRLMRLSADGSLDESFEPEAKSEQPITALALQPDGKILAAGSFTNLVEGQVRQLVRLNLDGSIDLTFVQTSEVLKTLPLPHQRIALQPDGKIIAIDGSTLIRLAPDGNFDPTFVRSTFPWRAFFPIATFVDAIVLEVETLPDGRILVCGESFLARLKSDGSPDESLPTPPPDFPGGFGLRIWDSVNVVKQLSDGTSIFGGAFATVGEQPHVGLARLYDNGYLDPGFDSVNGYGGIVDAVLEVSRGVLIAGGTGATRDLSTAWINRIREGPSLAIPPLVVVHPEHQTVTRGRSVSFSTRASSALPVSYQWRFNGRPLARATNSLLTLSSVGIQDAGEYDVLVSNAAGPSRSGTAVLTIRVPNHAGVRDFSFRPPPEASPGPKLALPDGKIIAGNRQLVRLDVDSGIDPDFGAEADGDVLAIVRQADGKFVIGGMFQSVNGVARTNVARLNSDGSLDAGFDPRLGGTDSVSSSIPGVTGLALQPDGKVAVVGDFSKFDGVPRYAIARLNSDGRLDPSFDAGQWFRQSANDGPVIIYAMRTQRDGRILLAGQFTTTGPVQRRFFARFNTDGTPDDGFRIGSGPNGRVLTIFVQSDDRILVGGDFSSFDGQPRWRVARLQADGKLDEDFPASGAGLSAGLAGVVQVEMLVGGKILVAGVGTGPYAALARLNSDGSVDTDFIPELTLPGGADASSIYRFVIDAAGNIVAVADGLGVFRLLSQAPRARPTLLTPILTNDGVRLWFSTFAGQRCVLEHSDSLDSSNWAAFPPIEGSGSTQSILDRPTDVPKRFYRVRVVD